MYRPRTGDLARVGTDPRQFLSKIKERKKEKKQKEKKKGGGRGG